jgi:hypothetical protein
MALRRRRREVIAETIDVLADESRRRRFLDVAQRNVARWRDRGDAPTGGEHVGRVVAGDWGVVTQGVTAAFGETFAVLNMANAYIPGGGYLEGCSAQEENMFRRTDCHFSLKPEELKDGAYVPSMSALLNAEPGRVYLDLARPRICVRGSEDLSRDDLGYAWLDEDEVFPFYELRAAAQDVVFDESEARRRITAQLDTLVEAGVRHAVLGAHGCGVFANPPDVVARLYRREVDRRAASFDCLVFAILNPSGDRDSLTPFREAFGR